MNGDFVVQRALMSVTDKSGLADFAKGLVELGTREILSTGGTAKELQANGIRVTEVAKYTGFPEIMGGRVKTLHPKIYGGILSRGTPKDRGEMQANDIEFIDLVCVNLYQFGKTVASGAAHEAVIENIDIGGPCLIRAAAKNYQRVIVVSNPNDYGWILDSLRVNHDLNEFERLDLAIKSFFSTKIYDDAIHEYLVGQ